MRNTSLLHFFWFAVAVVSSLPPSLTFGVGGQVHVDDFVALVFVVLHVVPLERAARKKEGRREGGRKEGRKGGREGGRDERMSKRREFKRRNNKQLCVGHHNPASEAILPPSLPSSLPPSLPFGRTWPPGSPKVD